jgi:UrcA family protein
MFKAIARYAPAVAAAGLLTSGSFSVSAQGAERAPEVPSVTVPYADLNLNTPAGMEALYARLRAAAREVCHVREGRPLVEAIESRTCYRQALDAAIDRAKSLSLNARRRAERGREDVS